MINPQNFTNMFIDCFKHLFQSSILSSELLLLQLVGMIFLRKRLITPIFRQQFNKNSSQIDERAERTKQIEFRKRMMEENQVKMMRESIENTKGQFSPLVQYIKLFKKQLFYFGVFGFFAVSIIIAWRVIGVYEDPFSKRKKILIVSDQFERSLEKNLRQTFVSHFGTIQKSAKAFQQSYQSFQARFKQLTGRDYRVVLVRAQDNVIIVLPGTIILSRRAMLSNSMDDLLRVLVLNQALFAKKLHIKDLALGNVIHFLTHWIKPSNVSDINMLKIYSKPFSKQQIQETINQISKNHHQSSQLSSEQIRKSLLKMIEQQSKNVSMFSLKTRMQAMTLPSE